MTWRKPGYSQTYPLLDPCAGEGEAIVTLRDLWAADLGSEGRRPGLPPFAIRACELEAQRAEALAERLEWQDRSFAGDCFRLLPLTPSTTGCALLFLNPPYDQDRDHQRLTACLDSFRALEGAPPARETV